MIRLRLDLSYRGTQFSGWARQPALRTVQGVLEEALTRVLREPVTVVVAGRTDAGVHARGQVVHVDVSPTAWEAVPGRSSREPGEALVQRLQGTLPTDVVVHAAQVAPPGFDARFSALRRRYAYRIADRPGMRDPLRRDWVLWARSPLDVDAMAASMEPLLGLRDFAAFCRPRPGASTIRELQRMTWQRTASGPDEGLVVATVVADAFCHNMVRALVGASIAVGEGRRDVGWPERLLRERARQPGVNVVAAHGLVLEEVSYPPDHELAGRARTVRARRMDEEAV